MTIRQLKIKAWAWSEALTICAISPLISKYFLAKLDLAIAQACQQVWTQSCLPQRSCLSTPDLSTQYFSQHLTVQQWTYICSLQLCPSSLQLKVPSALRGNHLSLLASLSLGEFSPTSGRPHLFLLFYPQIPSPSYWEPLSLTDTKMSLDSPQREVLVRVMVRVQLLFLFLTLKKLIIRPWGQKLRIQSTKLFCDISVPLIPSSTTLEQQTQ